MLKEKRKKSNINKVFRSLKYKLLKIKLNRRYKNDDERKIDEFVNRLNKNFTWSNDHLNMDEFYVLNKKFYRENAELYLEINPECILQTSIVLPFVLPINNKAFTVPFYSIREKARCSLTLYFSNIEEEKIFTGGFKQRKGIKYKTKKTRIEINAIFIEDYFIAKDNVEISILNIAEAVRQSKWNEDISMEDFIDCGRFMFEVTTEVIDCAIKFINSVIMAYAKSTSDTKVYCIDRNQVEHFTHFRVIEPKNWNSYNWLHLNNVDIPNNREELKEDEVSEIFKNAYSEHGSNFENFASFFQKALFRYSTGEMGDCIIFLIISTEILVKKIIEIYFLKIHSMSEDEVEEIISINSFKNMLDDILPSIIGGNWNLKGEKNIPSIWYNGAYRLRGRIIHSGYQPKLMETKNAIDDTQKIHGYIISLMRKKKNKLAIILEEFKNPYL